MKHAIFVHGALSTRRSFSFIKQALGDELKEYKVHDFSYDIRSEEGADIVDRLVEKVASLGQAEPITFIGHSFGGVISVEAVRQVSRPMLMQPTKVISMSTPYSGSAIASLFKLFKPTSTFFNNIGAYNGFMRAFSSKPLPCRVRGIITTAGGADWIPEENDGVVSVGSQLHYADDPLWSGIKLDSNHFEVLLHPKTADLIRKELSK